ncbi:MAG: sulfotransferase domain-containing protein [Kiloniellales bacterium]
MGERMLSDGAMLLRTSDRIRLNAPGVERGLLSLRTVRHLLWYDGVLVTMRQSGTHWIRYMVGLVLAKLYDLPSPTYIDDRGIFGKPVYRHIPRIADTSMLPNYFLRSRTLFRLLHVPNHVVLVRDLRDVLVSNYEKRRDEINVDFSTYLRGDVRGDKYRTDIWTRIRFLNAWGPVVERQPEHVAVLKYEDLKADTRGQLARVCDHFNIGGVTPDLLDEVVAAASKAEMAKLQRPENKWKAVRVDPRPAAEWYTDVDRRFFTEVCQRYLKHKFGYQYW